MEEGGGGWQVPVGPAGREVGAVKEWMGKGGRCCVRAMAGVGASAVEVGMLETEEVSYTL